MHSQSCAKYPFELPGQASEHLVLFTVAVLSAVCTFPKIDLLCMPASILWTNSTPTWQHREYHSSRLVETSSQTSRIAIAQTSHRRALDQIYETQSTTTCSHLRRCQQPVAPIVPLAKPSPPRSFSAIGSFYLPRKGDGKNQQGVQTLLISDLHHEFVLERQVRTRSFPRMVVQRNTELFLPNYPHTLVIDTQL